MSEIGLLVYDKFTGVTLRIEGRRDTNDGPRYTLRHPTTHRETTVTAEQMQARYVAAKGQAADRPPVGQ